VLYICKGYKPLSILKNIWATKVSITPMPLCCVSFSFYFGERSDSCDSKKKTMDLHVLPNIAFAIIVAASFDL
jgi:hypothetical protein